MPSATLTRRPPFAGRTENIFTWYLPESHFVTAKMSTSWFSSTPTKATWATTSATDAGKVAFRSAILAKIVVSVTLIAIACGAPGAINGCFSAVVLAFLAATAFHFGSAIHLVVIAGMGDPKSWVERAEHSVIRLVILIQMFPCCTVIRA